MHGLQKKKVRENKRAKSSSIKKEKNKSSHALSKRS
jgi:hypothetical protein